MITMAERVDLVVELAVQEHRRCVRDVSGSPDILRYYQDGLGWSWQRTYRNGIDQWCGAFASYCWGRGGLLPAIRYHHMASVTRLLAWASGTGRLLPASEVGPGDVLLVGSEGPSHIALAVAEPLGQTVETIEGNALGTVGDGRAGEGVIRRRRSLGDGPGHVHHVVRFDESDMDAAGIGD